MKIQNPFWVLIKIVCWPFWNIFLLLLRWKSFRDWGMRKLEGSGAFTKAQLRWFHARLDQYERSLETGADPGECPPMPSFHDDDEDGL